MKIFYLFLLTLNLLNANVITCGDVISLNGEAKAILHKAAQQRGQIEIEEFVGKKIIKPYYSITGKSNPKEFAAFIEVYWCESLSTPLHSAYYRFYSRNKGSFDGMTELQRMYQKTREKTK